MSCDVTLFLNETEIIEIDIVFLLFNSQKLIKKSQWFFSILEGGTRSNMGAPTPGWCYRFHSWAGWALRVPPSLQHQQSTRRSCSRRIQCHGHVRTFYFFLKSLRSEGLNWSKDDWSNLDKDENWDKHLGIPKGKSRGWENGLWGEG